MDDVSLYINFVLCAVLGKLSNADALMRVAGGQIRSVADFLAKERPLVPKTLYRGMLLDPAVPFQADPELMFLSWSEDRDVARWFACPRAVISEVAMGFNPKFRGHIVTLPAPPSRVLFHFLWASVFDGLAHLARMHPLMGDEGARQLAWSLATQSEVITDPVPGLAPEATDDLDAMTFAALERRLAPPWM